MANAKTWQNARIRPPAERCLADAQEPGGFADVEQIVCVGHAVLAKGVYLIVQLDQEA